MFSYPWIFMQGGKMIMKSPFKFIGNDDNASSYEGRFELPNDSTPDSDRYLVVTVVQCGENFQVTLSVDYPKWGKEKHIGGFETKNAKEIAELLYPTARVKIITTLVPT